jgi:2-haloalkanoic acid dehalogenase type II
MSVVHPGSIRACVFDAYGTLFDVHSVAALAEELFPGQGDAVSQLWRTKQIEYTWLRTMAGPDAYRTFWEVTEDGLVFTARRLGLELTPEKRRALMGQYLRLDAFPENLEALRKLKGMGLRLAILSNGNPPMLEAAVRSAGMEGLFEALLSVDRLRRFKTVPRSTAGGRPLRAGRAGDRVRVLERLGRGGGDPVRVHDLLGEPGRQPARGARGAAGRDGQDARRPWWGSSRPAPRPHVPLKGWGGSSPIMSSTRVVPDGPAPSPRHGRRAVGEDGTVRVGLDMATIAAAVAEPVRSWFASAGMTGRADRSSHAPPPARWTSPSS